MRLKEGERLGYLIGAHSGTFDIVDVAEFLWRGLARYCLVCTGMPNTKVSLYAQLWLYGCYAVVVVVFVVALTCFHKQGCAYRLSSFVILPEPAIFRRPHS